MNSGLTDWVEALLLQGAVGTEQTVWRQMLSDLGA